MYKFNIKDCAHTNDTKPCIFCNGRRKYIDVSWNDVYYLLYDTARKIHRDLQQYNIDRNNIYITPIIYGGNIPASILSSYLKIPHIKTIDTKNMNSKMFHISIHRMYIVVDDILDTGTTIRSILDVRSSLAHRNHVYSVLICTLFTKNKMLVDYYGAFIPKKLHKLWVHFPWEQFDSVIC